MKALRELRRFILAKCTEGNQAEVRAYVIENIDSLARAFHVPVETIMTAVEGLSDDRALAERLLETAMRTETLIRKTRKETRERSAQASAEMLAQSVRWLGDRAHVDMPSLLASCLTRRQDMLVFHCEDVFTVRVYMAPLMDLAKVARARCDLSGYVDRIGLHLRWRTGGLSLRCQDDDGKAEQILLHLPPVPVVVAA